MKKRITASALALVMALSVCVSAMPISNVQAKENDAQVQEDGSQESAETIDEVFGDKKYDSINWETDFRYEIQGDNIVLRYYANTTDVAKNLYIPSEATIDGVTYKVKLDDNCNDFFRNYCSSDTIRSIVFSKEIDTSNVTNMSQMFAYCSELTTLDISGFDTSNVTDMYGMFFGCNKLTNLDVSNFNTSNVVFFGNMFLGCHELTSIDVSSFDTSKAWFMDYMFYECSGLKELDLRGFDTSNVASMEDMFYECSGLKELDLRGFDTSNVTNMRGMFSGCSGLNELDLRGFDTSNVTEMGAMFSGCSGLKELDLRDFDTSKVTGMYGMFSGCSALTNLDLKFFDTSNVENMRFMFENCNSLSRIDFGNFNTSKVTDMYSMFYGCEKLYSLDLSTFDMSNVNPWFGDDLEMFRDCVSLREIKTPRNLNALVVLPGIYFLKDDITAQYTELPRDQAYSITIINPGAAPVQFSDMYRLFNPNNGEHLYSSYSGEIDWLVGCGWNNEGISWALPDDGIPVHRLYNPYTAEHHYTTDDAEKDWLIDTGWNYEGIGWYSAQGEEDVIPVYRLFNPYTSVGVQAHLYTTDEYEKACLLSTGWNDEGIGWYGLK